MQKNKERTAQTIKFLKWIKKYPGWWQLICEPGNDHMNLGMMQMLVKKLGEEGFYEIIFVLLEVHKNVEFLKGVKETLFKDMMISEWKNGNNDDLIGKLVAYLE